MIQRRENGDPVFAVAANCSGAIRSVISASRGGSVDGCGGVNLLMIVGCCLELTSA